MEDGWNVLPLPPSTYSSAAKQTRLPMTKKIRLPSDVMNLIRSPKFMAKGKMSHLKLRLANGDKDFIIALPLNELHDWNTML